MILDLHSHSIVSDDGRAKVENYCQWIERRKLPLDGLVLTEHRQFDAVSDYRALEDKFGLLILKASEVETEYGHVLVFGVNDDLRAAVVLNQCRQHASDEIWRKAGRRLARILYGLEKLIGLDRVAKHVNRLRNSLDVVFELRHVGRDAGQLRRFYELVEILVDFRG